MQTLCTEIADEFSNDKMYKLAEFRDYIHGLVRYPRKPSTLLAPVSRFVKQEAETPVGSETKFRQDMSREIPVN